MRGLYALTLRQPWAMAVAHGTKRVENRSWPAPRGLTELAIHAGALSGWDKAGELSPLVIEARRDYAAALPYPNVASWYPRKGSLHMDFGAIVAVATVTGCHPSPDFGGTCGATRPLCSEWAVADQYHWLLSDVRALAKPVPCSGRQKLWTLPDVVESAVLAQLEA